MSQPLSSLNVWVVGYEAEAVYETEAVHNLV